MRERIVLDPLDARDFFVRQIGPMDEVRDQAHDLVDRIDRDRNLQEVLVHDLDSQDVPGPPGLEKERNPLLPQPFRNLDLQRRELDQRDGAILLILDSVKLSHAHKYPERGPSISGKSDKARGQVDLVIEEGDDGWKWENVFNGPLYQGKRPAILRSNAVPIDLSSFRVSLSSRTSLMD